MAESSQELRKRKASKEKEVAGVIEGGTRSDKKKRRKLDATAVSENEQTHKERRQAKQVRTKARAEKRRLKAMKRDKREKSGQRSELSTATSGVAQETSTMLVSERRPVVDKLSKKNDQKASASVLAKPQQASDLAETLESRPTPQNTLTSPDRELPLKTIVKRWHDGRSATEMRNAEASSSSVTSNSASPKKQSREAKQRKIDTMAHDELLSTVWLSPSQIKEKVETEGMVVKTGIFSMTEKAQIEKFLTNYKAIRHLTEQQLADVINATGKKARDQCGSFWKEVAASVPGRPLRYVHAHLKRAYEPGSRKGPWTPAEDEDLTSAYMEFGPQWKKVALRVDRASQDCKDRWRNYVSHQDTRVSGTWSTEESDQLKKYVIELGTLCGKSLEDTANGIQWSVVAAKMKNTRSPAQCRIKWTDDILPGILSNKKKKWNGTDTIQMVKRILLQNPRDRSEVNWNDLPYSDWNHMSGHKCQKNFGKLIQSIPGADRMEFRVLLDELLKQGRRTEKERMARSHARQLKTLQNAKQTPAALLAAGLAAQSRYKSKEFVIDSDPDATDVEA